jgi:hypothetical protein
VLQGTQREVHELLRVVVKVNCDVLVGQIEEERRQQELQIVRVQFVVQHEDDLFHQLEQNVLRQIHHYKYVINVINKHNRYLPQTQCFQKSTHASFTFCVKLKISIK